MCPAATGKSPLRHVAAINLDWTLAPWASLKYEAFRMSGETSELRVSSLELFFDLVFVFTITQLTALLEHTESFFGVLKAAATKPVAESNRF